MVGAANMLTLRMPGKRSEHALGLERARQDDVARAARDVGEAIEAGAVRERAPRAGWRPAGRSVDVGVVAVAGEQQVAVAQHGALRAARWCRWCRTARLRYRDRRAAADSVVGEQRAVVGACRWRRSGQCADAGRRSRIGNLGACEAKSATASRPGSTPSRLVQLAVHRHRRQAGAPDAVQAADRTPGSSPWRAPRACRAAGRAGRAARPRCRRPAARIRRTTARRRPT